MCLLDQPEMAKSQNFQQTGAEFYFEMKVKEIFIHENKWSV